MYWDVFEPVMEPYPARVQLVLRAPAYQRSANGIGVCTAGQYTHHFIVIVPMLLGL